MGTNEYQELDESSLSAPGVIRNILDKLANYESAYKEGKREVLFRALCLCAQYQAVIPAWAADALLQGNTDLRTGERNDFNDLFGWSSSKQTTRKHAAKINDNSATVLAMLAQYRSEGGSLNVDEAFGPISDETGIPRRIAEEIYKQNKNEIKSIPQNNIGMVYGASVATVPILRRYGRKVL